VGPTLRAHWNTCWLGRSALLERCASPTRRPHATTESVFLAVHLVRCGVCGERLHANAGCGKPIYRDRSPVRGISCSVHRRRIDAAMRFCVYGRGVVDHPPLVMNA
jgi:hypothetical protein